MGARFWSARAAPARHARKHHMQHGMKCASCVHARDVTWEVGWRGVTYIHKICPRSAVSHPIPDIGPGRASQEPLFWGFASVPAARRDERIWACHAAWTWVIYSNNMPLCHIYACHALCMSHGRRMSAPRVTTHANDRRHAHATCRNRARGQSVITTDCPRCVTCMRAPCTHRARTRLTRPVRPLKS